MEKNKIESLMHRIYRTPLEIKILFLILTCLTLGFGTYVMYFLNSETRALKNQYKIRSNLFSETLVSGIKNIMLSGRAPYVRAFIEEAREEFDEVGNIQLFNNESEEIFPAINPHITIAVQDLKIRILNVIGEEISSYDLQQFVGEYVKTVNLHRYTKGIYFLEIETEDGVINKKLILQ